MRQLRHRVDRFEALRSNEDEERKKNKNKKGEKKSRRDGSAGETKWKDENVRLQVLFSICVKRNAFTYI